MNPDPTDTLASTTARTLRERILKGEYAPGFLMAEARIAGTLEVSRTPVREALVLLEREGLIEFSKSGRAYVKDLTTQDFEELFELRKALEPAAAKLAAERGLGQNTRLLERNIEATRRAETLQEVTRLDLDFHQLILEASQNVRLLKLWRSLRVEFELWLGRMHRTHQDLTQSTREETVTAHLLIVKTFREGTKAQCERLMSNHINGWKMWMPNKNN